MTDAKTQFDIVECGNDIFYVRDDGLIKLSSVPLCFQPNWVKASHPIWARIRLGRKVRCNIPVDHLRHYDKNITETRAVKSAEAA